MNTLSSVVQIMLDERSQYTPRQRRVNFSGMFMYKFVFSVGTIPMKKIPVACATYVILLVLMTPNSAEPSRFNGEYHPERATIPDPRTCIGTKWFFFSSYDQRNYARSILLVAIILAANSINHGIVCKHRARHAHEDYNSVAINTYLWYLSLYLCLIQPVFNVLFTCSAFSSLPH